MPLDVNQLTSQMLGAATPILKAAAPEAESFAKTEFTKVAITMASVAEQLAAGQMDKQQAALLLDMQRTATRNVLLTVQGMGLLTAANVVNAALAAVKGKVNDAVGVPLIT